MALTYCDGDYVITMKKDRFTKGEAVRLKFKNAQAALIAYRWLNGGSVRDSEIFLIDELAGCVVNGGDHEQT